MTPFLTAIIFTDPRAFLAFMMVHLCVVFCTPVMPVGGTTTLANVANSFRALSGYNANAHCVR